MTNANPYESPPPAAAPASSSMIGNLISVIGLLLAGVYLSNPTLGVFELLPDNIPGIGNLDEVVATTIFLTCLGRLGINILPQGPRKTVVQSHVVKE